MRPTLVLIALALMGCGSRPEFEVPPPSTTRMPSAVDAPYYERGNAVAFRLLHGLDTTENVAFSPVSVEQNLAVLMNGSSGKTREELLGVFDLTESNKDAFNESQRALLNKMRSVEGRPMKTACAVFLIWPVVLDAKFVEKSGRTYEAVVKRVGGATIEADRLINEWVRERTDGRIPELVTNLKKEEAVFVVNVAHFEDRWESPFDPRATKTAAFGSPGGTVQAPMMSRSGDIAYFEDDSLQAVSLPYVGSAYSMALVLPKSGDFSVMDARVWDRIVSGLEHRLGNVKVPQFSMDLTLDLIPLVKALGVSSLFDESVCNLRNMSIEMESGYWVERMVHKAVIEVDEEGTRASAATATSAAAGVPPGEPFSFVANRPFLFALYEEETKVIAFLGVVNDPTRS